MTADDRVTLICESAELLEAFLLEDLSDSGELLNAEIRLRTASNRLVFLADKARRLRVSLS